MGAGVVLAPFSVCGTGKTGACGPERTSDGAVRAHCRSALPTAPSAGGRTTGTPNSNGGALTHSLACDLFLPNRLCLTQTRSNNAQSAIARFWPARADPERFTTGGHTGGSTDATKTVGCDLACKCTRPSPCCLR